MLRRDDKASSISMAEGGFHVATPQEDAFGRCSVTRPQTARPRRDSFHLELNGVRGGRAQNRPGRRTAGSDLVAALSRSWTSNAVRTTSEAVIATGM